jgi:hypothetical protein
MLATAAVEPVGRFRRCYDLHEAATLQIAVSLLLPQWNLQLKTLLASAALIGCVFLSATAHAQTGSDRVKIGTLSCHEKSGWGFIFGSSHAVQCTFSSGTRVEHYDGSISKFGVDVGYQQSAVLIWGVVAPTDHNGGGALAGHYGGVTAGAAVGVGLGANALIGGSTTGISLQPLSIEGGTGLNIAAGVAELTLRSRNGV